MKVYNINVYNLYPAILGIRNAMKSKDKSDSEYCKSTINYSGICSWNCCVIGTKDTKLIEKLLKGPLAHQERKFMRQILVSMDIKGSIKFWAQMDTFKIATVRNSESTMHSITKGKLDKSDFEKEINQEQINYINKLIWFYNRIKIFADFKLDSKHIFEKIDANLPGGYLLESHWTGNYEVLRNIYHSRKNHKMYWWKEFCSYIEKLPYFNLLINK
jgi:hypothetical protein